MEIRHVYSIAEPESGLDSVRSIATQILSYMVKHPEADDSLEGILQWWLLEREGRVQQIRVKKAIRMLVDEGLLIEHRTTGSKVRYRANWDRKKKIEDFVNNPSDRESK
jgi:hypothetical protein